MCKGVQYLNKIKDSVVAGFQWASKQGALAAEKMTGICFEFCDVDLHADAVYRGVGQIIPTARRGIYASQLTAEPHLLEPIYLLEIQVPIPGTPLYNIKGYLPVIESDGFSYNLKCEALWHAYQLAFDHWDMVPSNPLDPFSEAYSLVCDIRRRKGLEEEIADLSEYEDWLKV
ncbi:hypothetical protein FXO38_32759 [Capsicum annuum]|uniref:Translation elongation factor EFG/EF2 domain-containing protein n=1 Tax=Capsicum annuum TaxID=4072 RepID=A0A2G2Z7I0_CAPAN|nr:hypothetical protein FXO38_32759 [Capsicum annuum]KAF3674476.1 hypothetical protein FXO37_06380 [Capsicum annuum]PHT77963.1 hypothetical protein T459_16015 [Capsicum annuum]